MFESEQNVVRKSEFIGGVENLIVFLKLITCNTLNLELLIQGWLIRRRKERIKHFDMEQFNRWWMIMCSEQLPAWW